MTLMVESKEISEMSGFSSTMTLVATRENFSIFIFRKKISTSIYALCELKWALPVIKQF
jgi:hypothetical protein